MRWWPTVGRLLSWMQASLKSRPREMMCWRWSARVAHALYGSSINLLYSRSICIGWKRAPMCPTLYKLFCVLLFVVARGTVFAKNSAFWG